MTVTEGLMTQGSWSLKLKPDTPNTVRSALGVWGHVVITPTRVRPELMTDAGILTGQLGRYSGVVIRVAKLELSGSGLIRWFGDESGKGANATRAIAGQTFSFLTTQLFNAAKGLSSGFISSAPTGTLTYKGGATTARRLLDAICDYWGTEWQVKPHGYLDIGYASELFVTTPTAVVTRRDITGELTYDEVKAAALNAELNAEEYTSWVRVHGSGEGTGITSDQSFISAPYFGLDGNRLVVIRDIDASGVDAGNVTAATTSAATKYVGTVGLRTSIKLSSDIYDIGHVAEVGDTIYVYDPDEGLVDAANQISHQGRRIFPLAQRVLGYTWPVDERMGVYFRSAASSAVWTDLTPWFEPEDGATTIEVGDAPKQVTGAAEQRFEQRMLLERQSR